MAYAGKVGESRPAMLPNGRGARPVGPVATGVALGLLVGAGVALLFAPQAGLDTRRDVSRGWRRVRRRGQDAWDDLRLELGHARRQLKRARRRTQLAIADRDVVDD
jgi:gas vesicle protein